MSLCEYIVALLVCVRACMRAYMHACLCPGALVHSTGHISHVKCTIEVLKYQVFGVSEVHDTWRVLLGTAENQFLN